MMKTVMVVKCWIKTKLRENTIKTLGLNRHGTGSHFVTQRPSDPGIQRPGAETQLTR